MVNKWLTEAVLNNAAWCDAIAASHGLSSHWHKSVWLSAHPMPPFYPNIVTLSSGSLIDDQINSIGPRLPSGWGIKDSFSELELDSKGFAQAFDAHWYCRVPNQSPTDEVNSGSRLQTVKTQPELNRWVAAWGESDEIFYLSLLENNAVELVYVERDGKIVAGVATNLSGDSVGISNAYGGPDEIIGCVDSVVKRHQTKVIVGYGDNVEVETLSRIGFQVIGDLRVWLRG